MNKVLICIYSSHKDLDLANDLKSYILKNCTLPDFRIVTVLTDTSLKKDYFYCRHNGKLFLNVKECYTYLSRKTKLMISSSLDLFDFDYLVKWDASTMDSSRLHAKRRELYSFCMQQLNSGRHLKHYSSHLRSECDFILSRNWVLREHPSVASILLREGRDLQSQSLIPKKISYMRGKHYNLSRPFCEFIKNESICREIFEKSFRRNYGCEDIAVGLCFQEFQKKLQS